MPLAGEVSGEWIASYGRLALAADVAARVESGDDRAWLVVSLSPGSNDAEVAQTMDAAHALLAEADAATAA